MRLYTPAKSSSPGGEDGEGGQQQQPTVTAEDKSFHFDSRSLTDRRQRTIENEPRLDDKLRGDDSKKQLQLTRLDDAIQFKSPLQDDRKIATSQNSGCSPVRSVILPEVNGTQNGSSAIDVLENGSDTIRSLDSVPWNLEGIETIKENGCKSLLREWSLSSDSTGLDTQSLSEEAELKQVKDENKRLKAALKEAAAVNSEWRGYHEQRQQYVQRLLTTIHELQQPRSQAHSPRQMLDVECGGEGEVRRLRGAVAKLQADHEEHVALLEMQVRAHRDDWEAERSEKQATQTALAEAQARTALLLQELQLLQAKLADSESKRGVCWRCGAARGDGQGVTNNKTPSGSTLRNNSSSNPPSASHSTQASPIPAPSPAPSGVSPTPLQEPQQAPLKGWIPVSMLHQIAFSGATSEHQTPVVQPQPQPQPQSQSHSHSHSHSQSQSQSHLRPAPSRPTTLNTGRTPSPRPTPEHSTGSEEKRRYEAMGARPKMNVGSGKSFETGGKGLGLVEEAVKELVAGGSGVEGAMKGAGLVEDERTAKHRARSILASAIPVSPVSGGPAPPFPPALVKSPSTPTMPKGYVPITSTVLTPVNFRPPFVAHKRPSAMKQAALQASSSPSPPLHARSGSSPAAMTSTPTTTANNSSSTDSRGGCDGKPNSMQQRASQRGEGVIESKGNKSSSDWGGGRTGGQSGISKSQTVSSPTIPTSSPPRLPSSHNPDQTTSSIAAKRVGQVHTTTSQASSRSTTPSQSHSTRKTASSNKTPGSDNAEEGECPGGGSRGQDVVTSPPTGVTTASTAFASITVTTTGAMVHPTSTASAYSSTASSRSSSPGMSLTTFGLNSEGRGIPGAIFFAMGSDQRAGRSPQPVPGNRRPPTSSAGVKSPTPDTITQRDARPPSGVKSPPASVNNCGGRGMAKEEHWWSVENGGGGRQGGGRLVNSTWVRLMGGQPSSKPGSGLPWRTARAVSGQQLDQARRASHDDPCVSPATATFTCTPAVNSPASSSLSSAASSAASSPPPCPNARPTHDLKSIASKNISSAIMSYELGSKCEGGTTSVTNDGVATFTRRDLVCPSCQMLFPPEKHVNFLDHFEACRGPEYADL